MSVFETLTPLQQSLIQQHLQLVIQANETTNLTRISNYDEGMILHVEDSLAGLGELKGAPLGLYGDLGSGAGYPGIPLAIATGRDTVLIDARKKKMEAVSSIVKTIGLEKQIKAYQGRAELLAQQVATYGHVNIDGVVVTKDMLFSVLTARALSQLSVLLELASPLLQHNGLLICYKAQMSDDELNAALAIQDIVGMHLVADRRLILDGEYHRRILTFAKDGNPRVKLPRQEGLAQKKPLSK